jgi:hypothetical protein
MSILHLATPGVIVNNFFPLIDDILHEGDHKLIGYHKENFNLNLKNIQIINNKNRLHFIFNFFIYSFKAKKIIIHGLSSGQLLIFLTLNPWLLSRCYWVIWGGDLYYKNFRPKNLKSNLFELMRKFIISRTGHFITHIKGDYELAQNWYSASGKWFECFMYPSNLYKESPSISLPHEGINIILGNSADPSNNHVEVLNKLKCHVEENIKIYCPLSYGNQSYAQEIADYGISHFGDKFIPLRDFMQLEKYSELLAEMDIAIFNHNRQQAMGNITTLLGMGKKVYIRREITTWKFLEYQKIKAFDANDIDISVLSADISEANKKNVAEYFSKSNLTSQLRHIFH